MSTKGRVLALATALSIATSSAPAFAQLSRPDSAATRAVHDRFTAMIARDLPALDTLVGEDLVYTHTDGLVQNKPQFLETLRTRRITYLAISPTDVRVEALGDSAAVLTGTSHMVLAASPTPLEFDIRFVDVEVRRHGRWMCIRWQSTRVDTDRLQGRGRRGSAVGGSMLFSRM